MTDLMKTIQGRRSVRTFDGIPVSEEDRDRLERYMRQITNPFGIPVRFVLLDAGKYGLSSPVLSGEKLYVAGKVDKVPYADVAFGYSFEKLVLYAWSLGIGTTWIGGTMKREVFEKAAGLTEGEMMPCISPLGYPANRLSIKEALMRRGVGADNRMPAEKIFFDGVWDAVLPGEIGFAFEIAKEILFSSKLRDEKRLREILQRLKTRTYAHLTSAGHSTAAGRAMSGFSAENLFSDAIGGVTFYQTLAGYENAFDEKKEELEKKLETVLGRLLKKDGFLVSFTGDEQYLDGIMDQAVCLAGGLQDGDLGKTERIAWIRDLRYTVRREGFLNPSKVQYVAQAGTFSGSGLSYTGALAVLKVILDYDYLWTNLRVVGGAYGCGSSFGRNGSSVFYSYRDPHLRNTLRVISGIADYVKDFSVDERDMTKYVIGTVSGFDTPLTPRTAGIRSLSAWVTGVETERLQKERDQVLDATAEDIRALQPYLEAILESSTICAVGSEEKLNSEKDLFDRVLAL